MVMVFIFGFFSTGIKSSFDFQNACSFNPQTKRLKDSTFSAKSIHFKYFSWSIALLILLCFPIRARTNQSAALKIFVQHILKKPGNAASISMLSEFETSKPFSFLLRISGK